MVGDEEPGGVALYCGVERAAADDEFKEVVGGKGGTARRQGGAGVRFEAAMII